MKSLASAGNKRKPNMLTMDLILLLTDFKPQIKFLFQEQFDSFFSGKIDKQTSKNSKLEFKAGPVFPLQAKAVVGSVRKWPELFLLQTFHITTEVIARVSGR